MPQMMPMNWELIFILVLLFVILISFKTFFYMMTKENLTNYSKSYYKKEMNMSWTW